MPTPDARAGTLVTPPEESGAIPGLVWGTFFDGREATVVDTEPRKPGPGQWLWLHFNLADMRARNWLSASVLLPKPAMDWLLGGDDTQQLVPLPDCVAGVFFDLIHDFDRTADDFGNVRFLLTDRLLISGRKRPAASIESVRRRLEAGQRFATPVDLLQAMVAQIADTIEGIVDGLSAEIDEVEDSILKEGVRDERIRLGRARLTAVRVHRRLNGLRGLLRRTSVGHIDGLPEALVAAAGPLTVRLDDIDHDVIELRDRARLLQEELGARVAEQTNRNLRVLSVLTAVLLPPALIAGLYGMNLEGVPFAQSPVGFWIAVLITLASSGLALLGLKLAGVLK
ncbi:MAG: cobalt transporter [Bauldia sp.]|nr:cobalt transporter [Bauldia sp.]